MADSETDALVSELEAALRARDEDKQLLVLLRAWARWRHPRLAEVIASLSRRRPAQVLLRPLDWHHAADRRDPRAVASLLAAPWRRDRPSLLRRKLLALADFPADPRIAAFAEEILLYYTENRPGSREARQAAEALRALHGERKDALALDPRLEALLASAAAQPDLEEELLEAVYARPDEDGPRLVYADYLIERGDPLGEHLLAMIRKPRDSFAFHRLAFEVRERWCRTLLGPGISPDRVEIRRGFPWALLLDHNGPWPPPGPGWATLQFLSLYDARPERFPWLQSLRGLPHLRGLGLFVGAELLGQALPSLAELPLREVCVFADEWLAEHGQLRYWPKLERLELGVRGPVRLDAEALGEIASRPLQIGLVGEPRATFPRALAALAQAAPALQSITISPYWPPEPWPEHLQATLERDEDGRFSRIRIAGLDWDSVKHLAELLREVRPENLTALTLHSALHDDRRFRQRVAQATPRFRALPVTLVP